jgi:dolichol-phosphate mannosyltransferase
VVVPTFKEAPNVRPLLAKLEAALEGVVWQAIFVDDDSPDGTAEAVRGLGRRDPRVRCLRRVGRRGLASACVEGMLATSAPLLAVMDADLQHDETLLPAMVERLRRGDVDLVVGTRYAAGTAVPGWDEGRRRLSRLATRLGRAALGVALSDPMSGFFAIRREALERVVHGLSAVGFKILLDILATARPRLRVAELPYRFRPRRAGESKLDSRAVVDFLLLVADKLVGRWVPVRFLLFAAVGALGVPVHLAVLALLYRLGPAGFVTGQAVAALAAMTFNFALNNELTFRDVRLRGRRWVRGWLSFVLACGVGLWANVGIASHLHDQQVGWLPSALAGVAVGVVWNYAVTSVYTWRR